MNRGKMQKRKGKKLSLLVGSKGGGVSDRGQGLEILDMRRDVFRGIEMGHWREKG